MGLQIGVFRLRIGVLGLRFGTPILSQTLIWSLTIPIQSPKIRFESEKYGFNSGDEIGVIFGPKTPIRSLIALIRSPKIPNWTFRSQSNSGAHPESFRVQQLRF